LPIDAFMFYAKFNVRTNNNNNTPELANEQNTIKHYNKQH